MIGGVSSFVDVQNRQQSRLEALLASWFPLTAPEGGHLSPILKDATAEVVVGGADWFAALKKKSELSAFSHFHGFFNGFQMFSGIVFNPEFQLGYTCATLCHNIFARSGIVETHTKIEVRPDLSVSEKGSGQKDGTFEKQGRFFRFFSYPGSSPHFLVDRVGESVSVWSDHRIVLKIITFDLFFVVPQMHGVCIRPSSLLALPSFRTPETHRIAELCP